MGTPARLNAMPLETVRLAERWKARAPVWAYSRAMLPAFTPLPGMIVTRPSAWRTSCASSAAPSCAVAHWPEVRIVSTPSAAACSSASCASAHTSNARCSVSVKPFAAARHADRNSVSSEPSARSAPTTAPLAPSAFSCAICSSCSCFSSCVNRKSPKRGRISTFTGTPSFAASRMSDGEGVVPPMRRLAHSSSRSAPPRTASRADSIESTHTSIRGLSIVILHAQKEGCTVTAPFFPVRRGRYAQRLMS